MAKTGFFLSIFRKKNQKDKADLIEAVSEIHEFKKAEKIVNEYGSAMVKATEINRKKVEEFGKLPFEQKTKSLENEDAYFYALQNKFDINLLTYDKATIKEAIELLLDDETDSSKKDVLMSGLLYLEDFVHFNDTYK